MRIREFLLFGLFWLLLLEFSFGMVSEPLQFGRWRIGPHAEARADGGSPTPLPEGSDPTHRRQPRLSEHSDTLQHPDCGGPPRVGGASAELPAFHLRDQDGAHEPVADPLLPLPHRDPLPHRVQLGPLDPRLLGLRRTGHPGCHAG